MESDPIAENQTNVVIAELMTRQEGDHLLNRTLAALLTASQRQSKEMADIKSSLWSPDALDRRISSVHQEECGKCAVGKWVAEYKRYIEDERKADERDAKKKRGIGIVDFLMSERGLLAIVILLFALMCARAFLGEEGFHDVTHTARSFQNPSGAHQPTVR